MRRFWRARSATYFCAESAPVKRPQQKWRLVPATTAIVRSQFVASANALAASRRSINAGKDVLRNEQHYLFSRSGKKGIDSLSHRRWDSDHRTQRSAGEYLQLRHEPSAG